MNVSENTKTQSPTEQAEIKKRKRKKTVKRIVWICVILLVLAVAAFFVLPRFFAPKNVAREVTYTYVDVTRRNLSENLSGSGTLESANSYTLSTRVSGDILSDTFSEGDNVKEGDVLYVVDSSEMDEKLERARKALSNAQENYAEKLQDREELTITAPISGIVSNLNLSEGDSLKSGSQVLKLTNTDTLHIVEYYSVEYRDAITVGMEATVSVPGQMLNVTGKVAKVSALTRTSATGVVCFPVTVEVSNPGSLSVGTSATAWIGDMYPTITSSEGLTASAVKTVSAGVAGDVEELNVASGDYVPAGTVIAILSADTLEDEIENAKDAVEDAELSLENLEETLESYSITAPIDGTVIRKVLKAGETVTGGETLCMIYDMSYLTVTLAVDELDIKSVSVGQPATVTADAMEGTFYQGVVTRVGVNGTTSGGVTTYPVDIRIDEADGLLPGMNADIVITIKQANNVLTVPVDAVARGNRVLVKNADGSTGEGAPEGFSYVTVEIGMADEDFVEIVSGLSEGDSVAYVSRTITKNQGGFGNMGMGMMPGGMGGMTGGNRMPSGGMSGNRAPGGNRGGF